MNQHEPVHVYIPADPTDPREDVALPDGVIAHRGPTLHPDDLAVVDGIPVTSLSRTLLDLAEDMDRDELREVFAAARARGLLDPAALAASRGRVEWRASLALFDEVCIEFGL